jgi:hypothetical protein
MLISPNAITSGNFKDMFPIITDHRKQGFYNYSFLLEVCGNITEEQEDILKPYIIDRFITEEFEEASWEGRFSVLEDAKEIYAKDMFGDNPEFVKTKITDCQGIFISREYPDDILECLIIPTKLFESDLAPLEVIVYTLKMDWHKSYSNIAKILCRDPRTIETVFKRAVFKLRDVK